MSEMSMTFDAYRVLLERLNASGRPLGGVAAFLVSADPRSVILRHDVDRRPAKSVAIARLEAERDVRSTFYFRVSARGKFPGRAVREIHGMGHEIGYHYETLSDCRGDRNAALRLFETNLGLLREICPCDTVSMHGRPLSRHNNEDLLRGQSLADFALTGDATLSIEACNPEYFTDVGGRWNHPHANLRDRVGQATPPRGDLGDPGFLQEVLRSERPLYISTHPERWSDGFLDHGYCRTLDMALNVAKRLLQPGSLRW